MKTKTLKRPASLSACVGLTLAVTVCTLSLPVQAQMPDISSDYTIQVLEPPQGTGSILALFINDNGMVVINYWGQNSVVCGSAAILEKGAWKDLIPLLPDGSPAPDCGVVNPDSSGRMMVCYCDNPPQLTPEGGCLCHHAIYQDGKYTLVGGYPTYGKWSWCTATPGGSMNDLGITTSFAQSPADVVPGGAYVHGLLVNKTLSLFQIFDPPGSLCTFTLGVNNAGIIVGQYMYWTGPGLWDGVWHGFLSDRGETFTDLDAPGMPASSTMLMHINNNKEICGVYYDQSGVEHGFVLRKGVWSTFDVVGSSWTSLNTITDNGKLSGVYADVNGNQYGFIATPKHGHK